LSFTDERSASGTTVWLARHGEAHNPRNVLYGRLPRIRLTTEGERQARALAEVLRPRPLQAIYSSPMLRARRTAEAVQAAHAELGQIRIDRDLIEVRTAWEGEPMAALERIDWDFYSNPRDPEDESLRAIHDRVLRWLDRVLRRHAGGEVLGVSHGDPILILVGTLSGLALDPRTIFPRPYIEPGVLYRMRFDGAGTCQDITLLVPHAEAAA
jgi:broad specificity phosphatase PhoE